MPDKVTLWKEKDVGSRRDVSNIFRDPHLQSRRLGARIARRMGED